MNALAVAVIGFLLGLRHAIDPDHVVAVTTILTSERTFRRALWIGALWGIGHSLALFAAGGAIIAFRLVVPPRVGLTFELAVAFMLILLGFRSLRPGQPHDHPHSKLDARRPLLIGIVHGLAGSAAVTLLVLTTIRSLPWAIAYLAIFGVGTIAGMMIVTGALAAPAVVAGTRMVRFERAIRLAAGAASVILGVLIAREIIVAGGLFSAAPQWNPR
jgi:hypothetical protein